MLFLEYTQQYEHNILPLKRPSTQKSFASHFRILNVEFGTLELSDISPQRVQAYIRSVSARRSPKTVSNYWATMKVLLTQAKNDRLIEWLPVPVLPEPDYTEQDSLAVEEMRKIISGATAPGFYALLSETGLRIGEALALRRCDLDAENRLLSINRTLYRGAPNPPKTRSGFRVIAISEWLTNLLVASPTNPEARIFPTSYTTALDNLKAFMATLDMQPVGFHAFRRGVGSYCQNILGVPKLLLQYRMGHAPEDVTEAKYGKPIPGADRPWAEKIAEALRSHDIG